MVNSTSPLKITFFGFIALCIIGYSIFNSRFLIQGPEIILEHTEDKIVSQEKTFFLSGQVLHSSFISLNDRPIFVDENGNFNEKLLLSNGSSIIDIYAKDKYGKETRKKINVVYKGEKVNFELVKTALANSELLQVATSSTSTESVATSTPDDSPPALSNP